MNNHLLPKTLTQIRLKKLSIDKILEMDTIDLSVNLSLELIISELICSPYIEKRALGVNCLITAYKIADQKNKMKIVKTYLVNRREVSDYKLVSKGASAILGNFCATYNCPEIIVRLSDTALAEDKSMSILASESFLEKGDVALTVYLLQKFSEESDPLIKINCKAVLKKMKLRDESHYEIFSKNNDKIVNHYFKNYNDFLEPS